MLMVRFHFQESPWDIYGCVGYTAAITVVLLGFGSGDLAAILLVLFVPGYVLTAVLFPSGKQIDWVERIALSLAFSVAVASLLGLLLNITQWGIHFAPIVVSSASFSAAAGLLAYWRRMQLSPEDRLGGTLELSSTWWKEATLLEKSLTAALVGSVIIASTTFASVVFAPVPIEPFTEFFILGPGGNASGYPTNLTPSEPGVVIIAILNHEGAAIDYTVRVDLVGVTIIFNTTCGCNQAQRVNSTTIAWINATVPNGGNWKQRFTFTIGAAAVWQVQFLLFRNGNLAVEYRELHLFVQVR